MKQNANTCRRLTASVAILAILTPLGACESEAPKTRDTPDIGQPPAGGSGGPLADAGAPDSSLGQTTPDGGPELAARALEFWGTLSASDSAAGAEAYYALSLQETDIDTFEGTSLFRLIDDPARFSRRQVTAQLDGTLLAFQEVSVLEEAPAADPMPCLRSGSLDINAGIGGGPWESTTGCGGGTFTFVQELSKRFAELPNCPCKFADIPFGRDVDGGMWVDYTDAGTGSAGSFHPGASKDVRWVPKSGGAGQQCTYDENGDLITGGLAAGTPDYTSPQGIDGTLMHFGQDVLPFYLFDCRSYLETFPPNNGNMCTANVVRPVPPGAFLDCGTTLRGRALRGLFTGDPHMRTLDGMSYDMQGVGEFVLLRSLEDTAEIQLRSQPWQASEVASVGVAVAARVEGDRVAMYQASDRRWQVWLNGTPIVTDSATQTLPTGGTLQRLGDDYLIGWPDGLVARIRVTSSYLNAFVELPPHRFGKVAGLLGDGDGQRLNDLVSREGRSFERNVTFDVFYGSFVESWRVTDDTSLFDYGEGESTETFTDRSLPTRIASLAALEESARQGALQTCIAAGIPGGTARMNDCVLDVALTGEPSFADDAARSFDARGLVTLFPTPELDDDFAEGSGRPFEGDFDTPCGRVSLRSTHTEPFGAAGFRDDLGGEEAEVVFAFEQKPAAFHLGIGFLRRDEYLEQFSVPPTTLSSTLTRNDGRVGTDLPGDSTTGVLSWFDPDVLELRFHIGGPGRTALAVERFGIDCETDP